VLSDIELIEKIEETSYLFDPIPVSKRGTNYNEGLIEITKTKKPGSRRLNLFDSFYNNTHSKFYNCTLYSGYRYSLSFCEELHYYNHDIKLYPGISELKNCNLKGGI